MAVLLGRDKQTGVFVTGLLLRIIAAWFLMVWMLREFSAKYEEP
jgi:hypothetical protein